MQGGYIGMIYFKELILMGHNAKTRRCLIERKTNPSYKIKITSRKKEFLEDN